MTDWTSWNSRHILIIEKECVSGKEVKDNHGMNRLIVMLSIAILKFENIAPHQIKLLLKRSRQVKQ